MKDYWRPVDLARAVGLSAQTVRTYERLGFLPPADRGATGYRRYEARHVRALQATRIMVAGYGWTPTLRIMRSVHKGEIDAAVAAVDACHASLHQSRHETLGTLTALRSATTPSTDENKGQSLSTDENKGQSLIDPIDRPLRISEVAHRVGVPVSTVRFWEKYELIRPRRDPASGYRVYDAPEAQRVQVIALLRHGGYSFDTIRPVLAALATGRPEQATQAAQRRLAELVEASRRCSAATAAFWSYIEN